MGKRLPSENLPQIIWYLRRFLVRTGLSPGDLQHGKERLLQEDDGIYAIISA